jgi:pyruvate ferredoxin oxidoreductase gamma subunit
MKEIRIHARAGQGAITTTAILGYAYFLEGKFPYAFPHFGAARMGAPMNAFVRVDDKPVRLRSQIYDPDYLLISDATLMRGFNCFKGFKDNGIAIISEKEGTPAPGHKVMQKIYLVPANAIAAETIGRPIGNTALLGAFVAATNEIKLDSLLTAIKHRFQGRAAEQNMLAVQKGYEYIIKSLQ